MKSTCNFVLAARSARAVDLSLAPNEGVGNAGCPLHPRPRAIGVIERTRVTTSTPESPGIPARNGFTTYFALSPVTGLFCHRRCARSVCRARLGRHDTHAQLDASIGASGPHDFAVRNTIARPCAADRSRETRPAIHDCAPDTAASTASRRTSVTIAIRPFVGRDDRINRAVSTKA
jgi:hypothetical protein